MDPTSLRGDTMEEKRLAEDASRERNWKRWGPYLSERQWATVREDYSPYGNCWDYFPHDHARSRAYRWGEDGLLGISDRQCRLCFGLALWNRKDPILKERLFGLTGSEGNHGEDATLHLLPTLWFRNIWSWGPIPEESTNKPSMILERDNLVRARHDVLGNYQLAFEGNATPLFTDNETNSARIHNYANGQQFVKDAFHEYVVFGRADAVNTENIGTKFAAHYVLEIEPGESQVVRLTLSCIV